MKNKLIFTLVFVTLIFVSCKNTLNVTVGKYKEKGSSGVFMIYPNNTFTFSTGEITKQYSNGNWIQYDDTLILNSTVQNEIGDVNELENSQPAFVDSESEKESLVSIDGEKVNMNLQVPDSLLTYRVFTNTSIKFKRRSLYFRDPEKDSANIKYKLKDGKKSVIKSIKKKNLHKNSEESSL